VIPASAAPASSHGGVGGHAQLPESSQNDGTSPQPPTQ
jgi:hypothetical protein